jgi:phosphate transport system substrate-binding protein
MKKLILFLALFTLTTTLSACGGNSFEDQTINVYTRDTESGTREAFFKGIDFGDAAEDDSLLVETKTVVSGNSDMISKVKADEYGLGYISLSSLDGSGLTGLTFDGVEATISNVLDDSYGLKRPFNYMTRVAGDYASPEVEGIVEALVAYMETVEGKAIIAENGGIVETSSSDENWDDIADNFDICTEDNSNVDINVGGSTSVEKIAKALTADFKNKCGGFNPLHNHQGSSSAYKGVQNPDTKDEAATYLDLGFASRGFKDTEAGAEGTYGQICWDAVVAVVNSANEVVTNVSAEDLKKIYDGTFGIWQDLVE